MTNGHTDKAMSFISHFNELRRKVFFVAIALVVGTIVATFFAKEIYAWLQEPLLFAMSMDSDFIILTPVESWIVYIKVAIVTSIFATSPFWLYQFWSFIAPGLYKRERTSIIILGISSAAFLIGGALFCYYLIAPYGFEYFVSIIDDTDISLMPQMGLYFAFMLRLLFAFGIVFEIPLVIIFLVRWDIVPLKKMRKARPFVILAAFIIAAIITPPDVFTQIAVAIPFIILYEISLLIAWIFWKKEQ